MKIACIGNFAVYFIPRLISFGQYLKDKGHELIVIEEKNKHRLYEFANDDKSPLNRIVLFRDNDENNPSIYREKLLKTLDSINPDVVITGFISFPFGATGLKWAKDNNKAIVEFDNQRIDTFPRNRIVTWIKYRLLRNVDAFLCPAPAWDETLIKYGFKKNEIFYGLNTSDNKFWSTNISKDDFEYLGTDFFLTVGRQTSMKNLDSLLLAYKNYEEEGGTTPLVMVGNGLLNSHLKTLAGDSEKILFIDFQEKEKLKELFSRMKALILPSFKFETWGMVVNEAMAQGAIAAVSNECGCATTLVIDDKNGFKFNPHSIKEIKETLFKLDRLTPEKQLLMKAYSLEIIKDWDLDRFSEGLFNACLYANENKKKVNGFIDKIIINYWKGRYNYKDTIN